LPCQFSFAVRALRPSRPRWRSAGRRRSTTHPSSGRSTAEDGGGETFLARARNGRSPGEESLTVAVAAQAIEAQPSFGQIKPSEATWLAPVRLHGEDVADIVSPAQEATLVRRKKRNPGVLMGGLRIPGLGSAAPAARIVSRALKSARPRQSKRHSNRPMVMDHDPKSVRQLPLNDGRRSLQPFLANDVSGAGTATPAAAPSAASDGAEKVMRAQAVAATMIAAATAIACRQPSAGPPMDARPRAA
jgi:hypothetical protein